MRKEKQLPNKKEVFDVNRQLKKERIYMINVPMK